MSVRNRRKPRNQRAVIAAKRRAQEIERTMKTINATKMVALLVLRNQGWGAVRLKRFSGTFDEIMVNVSQGWLSTSDIPAVLLEETGLKLEEIAFNYEETEDVPKTE